MKPILFNSEIVRAILDGRKTQTRRPVKPQPRSEFVWLGWCFASTHSKDIGTAAWGQDKYGGVIDRYKPKYVKGDILYVRETFCLGWDHYETPGGQYIYKADVNDKRSLEILKPWTPSIHMPKAAARIFLKVTDVRIERLKDMPHDAPMKEGIKSFTKDGIVHKFWHKDCDIAWSDMPRNPTKAFEMIWDSIYGKDYPSKDNPWVIVYEFERCEKPEGE